MSTVRARDGVPEGGPLVKWPKTPASHAGNTSSNLVRVTMIEVYLNKRLWMNSSEQSASLAMRVHPFPSRTRQLSSSVLKILGWKRPGKIRRCRHTITALEHLKRLKCLNSSVGRFRCRRVRWTMKAVAELEKTRSVTSASSEVRRLCF